MACKMKTKSSDAFQKKRIEANCQFTKMGRWICEVPCKKRMPPVLQSGGILMNEKEYYSAVSVEALSSLLASVVSSEVASSAALAAALAACFSSTFLTLSAIAAWRFSALCAR